MNAPETQIAAPLFGVIPRTHIRLGKWNPRKRITEAELQELADSIRAHSLMQPILVRPIEGEDDMYELVFGERRFRAAEIAELEGIPCQVRVMTDKEVRIAQHIENLKRKDVHPIEEAEGYEVMMKEDGYTADQLADEVGKSRSYIYGRLKLCALAPAAREAFYDGKLSASTALLIARIPVESLQEHAAEEILNDGEPLAYRAAFEHIQERYMLNLDRARFSITDAKLVKVAGSCEACPKRAGNQPMIFEGVDADVCTDPNCFASKSRAHDDKTLTAAQKKGIPVYEGEEAQMFLDDTELVSAEDRINSFDRRIATSDSWSTTVGDLLKPEELPKPAAFVRVDGKVTPMFEQTAMQEALEKAGVCETVEQRQDREAEAAEKAAGAPAGKGKTPAAPQVDIRALAAEQEAKVRLEAYKRVRTASDLASNAELLRPLLKALIGIYETYSDYSLPDDVLSEVYDFDTSGDEAIAAYIDQAPAQILLLLLMDTIIGRAIDVGSHDMRHDGSIDEDDGYYQAFTALIEAAGINLDAIRAEKALKPEQPTEVPEPPADNLEPKVGDRVRINNDVRGPNGKLRKCCGREGAIESVTDAYFTVRFGPQKHEIVANLVENEFTKIVETSADEAPADEPEKAQRKTAKSKAPKDSTTPAINPAAAWPFPTGARP
jgi:ParB/RepB/Spo0J family partition protein